MNKLNPRDPQLPSFPAIPHLQMVTYASLSKNTPILPVRHQRPHEPERAKSVPGAPLDRRRAKTNDTFSKTVIRTFIQLVFDSPDGEGNYASMGSYYVALHPIPSELQRNWPIKINRKVTLVVGKPQRRRLSTAVGFSSGMGTNDTVTQKRTMRAAL